MARLRHCILKPHAHDHAMSKATEMGVAFRHGPDGGSLNPTTPVRDRCRRATLVYEGRAGGKGVGYQGAFLSSSMNDQDHNKQVTCTDTVPVSTAPLHLRHSPSLPYSMHI
ncbi:hypothetical protein FQA47_012008 [Oryzias melastigma]|uniref:Uncharacterized protein n=1 Tax=Oryzias melastigma TaxID=30732 RepID=A0A834CNW0_ORYME|nr:hypothetical protein FQA47_012008 [Oryzias melastigma]